MVVEVPIFAQAPASSAGRSTNASVMMTIHRGRIGIMTKNECWLLPWSIAQKIISAATRDPNKEMGSAYVQCPMRRKEKVPIAISCRTKERKYFRERNVTINEKIGERRKFKRRRSNRIPICILR